MRGRVKKRLTFTKDVDTRLHHAIFKSVKGVL